MNEKEEEYSSRDSWPGPSEWYKGALEIFEASEKGFEKAQATTKPTEEKEKK